MAYWFQLDGINCDILQLLCGFSALYLFIFCLFVYILVYPFNRLLACWLAFRLAGLRVCGLAGSRACFWAPNSGVLIQLQVWHRSRRFPRFKLWLYLQTCKQNECVTVRTMLACMLMTLQLQVYLTLREWRAWQQAKPRFNHVCKNLHVGLTCVFPFSEELEEYCVPSWGRLSQPSQTGLLIFFGEINNTRCQKNNKFCFWFNGLSMRCPVPKLETKNSSIERWKFSVTLASMATISTTHFLLAQVPSEHKFQDPVIQSNDISWN